MTNFHKLSETEAEVMQIIWDYGRPVTSGELLQIFKTEKGKVWRGQTIATFLARLVEKGLLSIVGQQGRNNIYAPCMTPEEYKRREAKSLLEALYEGSVKNFLSALYDGEKLTKNEIDELKRWFEEKVGERDD